MKNNIDLIQEIISSEIKTMWDELECILDGVDADFTGANGEEYYNEEGVSYMESAINEAEKIECEQEQIEYVLEKCKEYSCNYYEDFKYSVMNRGDGWLITIATILN